MQSPQYGRGSVLTALLGAVLIGSVIVVAAVLPAEYGVDPTGIGERLGLLQLAASKAPETPTEATPVAAAQGDDTALQNVATHALTLEAGEGVEFKLEMNKGQRVTYRWLTSAPVHVDLHGEPAGDTTGYYESYMVSTAEDVEGKFTALFDGTHGWYWRNDTDDSVSVDLRYGGEYLRVKDMEAP